MDPAHHLKDRHARRLRSSRDLPYLSEQFDAGKLVPVIDGPYTLSEGREAFHRFGAGQQMGKIVMTLSTDSSDG